MWCITSMLDSSESLKPKDYKGSFAGLLESGMKFGSEYTQIQPKFTPFYALAMSLIDLFVSSFILVNSDLRIFPVLSTMKDRISALPDEIIHHILSFMDDIEDVIQTSILSNRWKHVWLTIPTLSFCSPSWYVCDENDCQPRCDVCHKLGLHNRCDKCIRCDICKEVRIDNLNIVDGILDTRQCNLVKFEMYDLPVVDAKYLLKWINKLSSLCAQEITFFVKTDESFQLPHSFFNNPYIRVLVLDFRFSNIRNSISLPNSISGATKLTRLDLSNVRFPDGNAKGEFTLSLAVLQNLSIGDCDLSNLTVLTVSTPLIKRLKFSCLYTTDNASCNVKTSAPTLRSLNVTFSTLDDDRHGVNFCVEDLVSLISAYINVVITRSFCSLPLIEFLTGICNVQMLSISDLLIQGLTAIPESLERFPKLLRNLISLTVRDHYSFRVLKKVQKVQEAIKFLERLPHIQTLVWERRHEISLQHKEKTQVVIVQIEETKTPKENEVLERGGKEQESQEEVLEEGAQEQEDRVIGITITNSPTLTTHPSENQGEGEINSSGELELMEDAIVSTITPMETPAIETEAIQVNNGFNILENVGVKLLSSLDIVPGSLKRALDEVALVTKRMEDYDKGIALSSTLKTPSKVSLKKVLEILLLGRGRHLENLREKFLLQIDLIYKVAKKCQNRCGYEDEDWLVTMPPQGIFSCLQRFEYHNFLGCHVEQKFLEFLLERATVLKELIIKTPRFSPLDEKLTPSKEKLLSLSLYGDKLSSLPRASSSVKISYQLS